MSKKIISKKPQKQPLAARSGNSMTKPGARAKKPGRARQATSSTGQHASTLRPTTKVRAAPKAQRLVATRPDNTKSERSTRGRQPSRLGKGRYIVNRAVEPPVGLCSTGDVRAEEASAAPATARREDQLAEDTLSQASELGGMRRMSPPSTTVAPFAIILRQQAVALRLMLDALQVQRQFILRAFYR